MGFAVHDSTGVTSLTQIKKERLPLKLSTRLVTQNALKENSTMFTVAAVMRPLDLRLVTFASGAEKFIWLLGPAIRLGVPPSRAGQSTRSSMRGSRVGRGPLWIMVLTFCPWKERFLSVWGRWGIALSSCPSPDSTEWLKILQPSIAAAGR